MSEGILTKTGRLKNKYLPAVYFDSSVVIDYWLTGSHSGLLTMATGYLEMIDQMGIATDNLIQRNKYLKRLIHSKATTKLNKVSNIREKLNSGKAKATAVVSPICLLELGEWYAFARFKQMASEAVDVTFLERQGKKDFGNYLKVVYDSWLAQLQKKAEFEKWTGKKLEGYSEEENIFYETFPDLEYLKSGLDGLLLADIRNYGLDIQYLFHLGALHYAYIQLGAADILHIFLARHLGCRYIASFDTDFKRVKQVIIKSAGMELLGSAQEILDIL